MASTSATAQQEMLVKLSTDGVPKLFCPICNNAHVSLSGYVKHLKKHEPPGGFCCRYCEDRFCTDEELKKHHETQHITIACRLCKDINFTNEDDYRTHIRDVHKGIDRQLYNCDKCGAAYKTLEPYRRHIKTECGSIKPYKCDQCEMAFVTKYNLKQHVETHSAELKFCCSYCGRNFRMKARLMEHERTHTGEKPYKCDVCGKRFSHRESIVTHSSIHTGVRLVECRCCSSRFSCYSNLIKHRRNRPDTCGLPEYDPPRNRIRKHTSRIPAMLNPTSEIRVVNDNKIIKPDLLEKANALKKESCDKLKKKATARKSTGGVPNTTPRKRGPKKKIFKKPAVIEFEDSDNTDLGDFQAEDNENDEWPENTVEITINDGLKSPKSEFSDYQRPKRQCKPSAAGDLLEELHPEFSTKWSDDSEDDYIPDIEPEEDDSDNESSSLAKDLGFKSMPTRKIKPDPDEMCNVTTQIQIEHLNDFEFSTLNSSEGISVKSEFDDENNLFNEKDKILECLLNENDYSRLECEKNPTPTASSPKKWRHMTNRKSLEGNSHKYLHEKEVTLVKNEDEDYHPMEDMLELKGKVSVDNGSKECFVLVEDITHRFPELKNDPTIKVPRNIKPYFSKSGLIESLLRRPKRGKYKKRDKTKTTERPKPTPKRPRMTAGELKEHMKMLRKRDKVYQCEFCIKMYHMRKPYERHLREDHNQNDETVRQIFQDEDVHLSMENVYKCHICNKVYLMQKRLQDHIPKHGPDGNLIYKCPCYCSLYFASRSEALAHAQEAHREQLWCEICQKFLNGVDTLKSHRIRIHGENKNEYKWHRNLVCDKCGKKFMGRTQLTDHVRSDCGRVPIYQCQVCGKCLTTAGILKTHMLLHQDERPFQCEQCGKSFKIKAQYKSHIQFSHSDVKRFKCHLCPKEYPYRESLLTHMAVHTGIKRFLCNGCGKRFTCVSNLQAHRKVHAETCGLLPLNAKATQYMGVQKGTLLLGSKPEPGLDYVESQTLVAKEVYTPESPLLHDISTRVVQPSDTLSGGMPLNYTTNDMIIL